MKERPREQRYVFAEFEGKKYYVEDVGNSVQIRGAIFGDGENDILIYLPSEYKASGLLEMTPSVEEWQALLAQSDNSLMVITDPVDRSIVKATVRKNQRMVEESVRWKVYHRDGYKCMYCGRGGANVPLTVDHILAQELGGATTLENMVAACRPCNKLKRNMTVDEWLKECKKRGIPFTGYPDVAYLITV